MRMAGPFAVTKSEISLTVAGDCTALVERIEPNVHTTLRNDCSDLPSLDFFGSLGAHVVHTQPSN
jgi:hypothetical protein